MKYLKKETPVEAVKAGDVIKAFNTKKKWDLIPAWFKDYWNQGHILISAKGVTVKPPGMKLQAAPRDWIVREEDGEIVVRTAKAFKDNYRVREKK